LEFPELLLSFGLSLFTGIAQRPVLLVDYPVKLPIPLLFSILGPPDGFDHQLSPDHDVVDIFFRTKAGPEHFRCRRKGMVFKPTHALIGTSLLLHLCFRIDSIGSGTV
jgi:hypothetical protein